MAEVALWRRLTAEFLGSAFLAALVIGSGIAAQHLSPGDTGLELLENAAATAAGLFAIILMFGPVSGGHFNPVVSFVDAAFRGVSWRDAAAYLPAQVAGCIAGAVSANLMFALPAVSISVKDRATAGHFLSEIIATLGLMLVIFALARSGRSRVTPAAVGAYIGAAYFFTSSASFANPAITIGRMFSNTFAGIAPSSAPRPHRRPGRRRHPRHRPGQASVSGDNPRRGCQCQRAPQSTGAVPKADRLARRRATAQRRRRSSRPRGPGQRLRRRGSSDAPGHDRRQRCGYQRCPARPRAPPIGRRHRGCVADAYPNFSICGIPYYVSGEVTHWRNLAHRTVADLEATGMVLRLDTIARRIDVPAPASCKSAGLAAPTTGLL